MDITLLSQMDADDLELESYLQSLCEYDRS